MSNPYFQFKKFKVFHEKSSMKVGTDAVLLACLSDFQNTHKILEVGCGSGVVTLIAAQLSVADIKAIDIHQASVEQAHENFELSRWKDRLSTQHISLQELSQYSQEKYDLIISNPPFFIDALKSPIKERNLARHNDTLSQTDLLQSARRLLNTKGTLSLILPLNEGEELIKIALEEAFYLKTRVEILPKASKPANRLLIELALVPQLMEQKQLIIRKENNDYTEEYKELTKDFYLAF